MNILGVSTTHRTPPPLWVQVVGVLIGVPWAGFFAWCLYQELANADQRHADHVTEFVLCFLLGAAIAFGRWFLFPIVQQTIVLYGDYRRGGRRRNDPPSMGGDAS